MECIASVVLPRVRWDACRSELVECLISTKSPSSLKQHRGQVLRGKCAILATENGTAMILLRERPYLLGKRHFVFMPSGLVLYV